MTRRTASFRHLALLHEVLAHRASDLLVVVLEKHPADIPTDVRRKIQEVLGDELIEKGLRDDSEPNARGLDLETLIDYFSPYGD